MRRNLRFWSRYTWESMEAELIAMGAFVLISAVSSDPLWTKGMSGQSGWTDYLALAPFYLIVAAVICIMILGPGSQTLYIPLLISNGEPRKNIFWGYQFHRLLLVAATSVIAGLTWLLIPSEISDACLSCLPMIVTGLVICSSAGNLLGSAYVKWKWFGMVAMVLFFGVCGGLGGWLVSTGGLKIPAVSLLTLGLTTIIPTGQMAALAAALLAVDLGVQWLLLRRREVKF